jgi:hypothetical protein
MNRRGFALAFVLLIIAAVELLTLATLAIATHESLIADARVRTVVAARTADAALATLAGSWPMPALDTLSIGGRITWSAGNRTVIELERTAWGTYHARAIANSGRATIRRAVVLRKLDAARGIDESSEAMVAAGPIAAPFAEFEIANASGCIIPRIAERPPALITLADRHHALGLPVARVDSLHAVLPAGYALAGVRWDELASIADVHANGTIALIPTDSAGALLFPLILANDDLILASGKGQGLIFVHGNLQIQPGVQFDGIIVVHGTVSISDDVQLTGTLRTQGSALSNIGRARIIHSPCAVADALIKTPAAARLIRAFRTHIPAF